MIQNIFIISLIGLSLFLKYNAAQHFLSAPRAEADSTKISDAQYEVYLRNSDQTFKLIREAIVKTLPQHELNYLKKDVKKLGVFVDIDLTGKVVRAEVDYFSNINISAESKKAIGNIFVQHCKYDVSQKARRYYSAANRQTVTLIYTLPVENY